MMQKIGVAFRLKKPDIKYRAFLILVSYLARVRD